MSIQGNINQTLSLASLLLTQTPAAKIRKEGLSINALQQQSIRGIRDIEKNLRREELTAQETRTVEEDAELQSLGGPKTYTAEEIGNIEARAKQHQQHFYDARAAALNPSLAPYIQHPIRQEEFSRSLGNISERISAYRGRGAARERATAEAQEALQTRQAEREASERFRAMITEGVTPEYGVRERF